MLIGNEIFLHFVTSIVTPLKSAAENGEAARQDALETIKKIIALAAVLEDSVKVDVKDVSKQSTQRTDTTEGHLSFGEAVSSPLDKWMSAVRRLAPRQRSIAREIEILRTLEETNSAVVLNQLHGRLVTLGLSELGGQAAVVTQISRLKKLGAVKSEAQGLYACTEGGADRLQKLRRNYGPLFVPKEIREGLPHSNM